MRELPPLIEHILSALGVNTSRLRWKLHYWEQDARKKWAAAARPSHGQRYKHCRHCGGLALAGDARCKCGHRLPSYLTYWISRLLALERPDFAIVSFAFLSILTTVFVIQVMVEGAGALMGRLQHPALWGGLHGLLFFEGEEYWRALTFGLSHYGLLHIAFNAMAISQMLPRFETEIGPWRTLLLVTATQLGAGAASLALSPGALVAGASGIAFGLVGFGLARAQRSGNRMERDFYLHWLAYGLAFTFLVPNIAIGAHLGGLAAGAPLGWWMQDRRGRAWMRAGRIAMGVLCLGAWIVCIGFWTVSASSALRERRAARELSLGRDPRPETARHG